jgi:hypothetical protein
VFWDERGNGTCYLVPSAALGKVNVAREDCLVSHPVAGYQVLGTGLLFAFHRGAALAVQLEQVGGVLVGLGG